MWGRYNLTRCLDWPWYSKGAENHHPHDDSWLSFPTKALLHPSNRTHCSDIPCSLKRPHQKEKNTHNQGGNIFFWGEIRKQIEVSFLSVYISSLVGCYTIFMEPTLQQTKKLSKCSETRLQLRSLNSWKSWRHTLGGLPPTGMSMVLSKWIITPI